MKGVLSRLFFSVFFIMVMVGVAVESLAEDERDSWRQTVVLSENADKPIRRQP